MIRLLATAAISVVPLWASNVLAQTNPVIQPLKPTNYGIFGPQGYGVNPEAADADTWIDVLNPEIAGVLQCVRLTHTADMRCYGDNYHLTIKSKPHTASNVNYRIGADDPVGVQLRTHPAADNPEAILEMGIHLP